jgi:hypothetical protein
MGMFTVHYLIKSGDKYWNGKSATKGGWSDYEEGCVRFYTKHSAQLVVDGILNGVAGVEIEEDE